MVAALLSPMQDPAELDLQPVDTRREALRVHEIVVGRKVEVSYRRFEPLQFRHADILQTKFRYVKLNMQLDNPLQPPRVTLSQSLVSLIPERLCKRLRSRQLLHRHGPAEQRRDDALRAARISAGPELLGAVPAFGAQSTLLEHAGKL